MPERPTSVLHGFPGIRRVLRVPGQLLRRSPFSGDICPGRVPLFQPGVRRPSLPFPHPWNYQDPIRILETYYCDAETAPPDARHNRYLDVPGFPPVLVTRDPAVIRAILTATGDREGQFDRDTLPSTGIARATGKDTLLFSNGPFWRRQRKIAASPFGKTALFQEERFNEFGETARQTIRQRLEVLRQHMQATSRKVISVKLEPEIKSLMLELLVCCFFGAPVSRKRISEEFVPAFERVIDHIVRDTVSNRLGLPVAVRAAFSSRYRAIQSDFALMEELTDIVLSGRHSGRGLWSHFRSDVSDQSLRSNLKVFLAGALEATTSYATWAVSHLARHQAAQQKVLDEVAPIDRYTPEGLAGAVYLNQVLDETLRLTPSLYFLPRRATADTSITTADSRRLNIPAGTHILLDIWHANRHEDHWGSEVTGFSAGTFAPERWDTPVSRQRGSKELLHFGFGHGARVCPGKHLGQLEVALIVGAFVKLFRFRAPHDSNEARAGVSTRPADGTLVELEARYWPDRDGPEPDGGGTASTGSDSQPVPGNSQ